MKSEFGIVSRVLMVEALSDLEGNRVILVVVELDGIWTEHIFSREEYFSHPERVLSSLEAVSPFSYLRAEIDRRIEELGGEEHPESARASEPNRRGRGFGIPSSRGRSRGGRPQTPVAVGDVDGLNDIDERPAASRRPPLSRN